MGIFGKRSGEGGGEAKPTRLLADGDIVPAKIYAIRIEKRSGGSVETSYGLDIEASTGPRRVSVCQQLLEEPQLATLGAEVVARYLDEKVAIDWSASLQQMGVAREVVAGEAKTLKQPLEAGIDDERIDGSKLNKGRREAAKLLSFEPADGSASESRNWRIEIEVQADAGPLAVLLENEFVPPYAQSLLAVGAALPVAVDLNDAARVTIDWPSAAERAAGAATRPRQQATS